MTKVMLSAIVILFLCYGGLISAKHFWRGEVMSVEMVGQKWGKTPFETKVFKNGDEKQRAQMAYSLLNHQNQFVGKDRLEIRSELGDPDGFYFSEMFPAYMIETATSREQNSWQIVFLLDRDEKVSQIIVHKNCCDWNK